LIEIRIGDQLLQSGFQSPVMEMETLTLTYQSVTDLLRDLKAIGAQTDSDQEITVNAPMDMKLVLSINAVLILVVGLFPDFWMKLALSCKDKFQSMIKMYESYRQDGKLPATYEVVYGHAWVKINELGGIKLEQK
jgi:malonyl-CoA O-methyltransferase